MKSDRTDSPAAVRKFGMRTCLPAARDHLAGRYSFARIAAMAIQFPCPSCNQPIEVDEEWANRPVACPYCRLQVAAPARSTLEASDEAPQAVPVQPQADAAPEPYLRPHQAGARDVGTNKFGLAAVCLALACIGCVVGALIAIAPYMPQLEAYANQSANTGTQLSAVMDFWNAEIERNGGRFPNRLIVLVLFELACPFLWIAAIVCAIIGLRRPPQAGRPAQRTLPIVALAITLGTPLVFCCGAPLLTVLG